MLFRPYDRLEAVSYAHRWAYGRNPAFSIMRRSAVTAPTMPHSASTPVPA